MKNCHVTWLESKIRVNSSQNDSFFDSSKIKSKEINSIFFTRVRKQVILTQADSNFGLESGHTTIFHFHFFFQKNKLIFYGCCLESFWNYLFFWLNLLLHWSHEWFFLPCVGFHFSSHNNYSQNESPIGYKYHVWPTVIVYSFID